MKVLASPPRPPPPWAKTSAAARAPLAPPGQPGAALAAAALGFFAITRDALVVNGFVDAVFRLDGNVTVPPSALTKRDYVARALRGGYPEAVRRDPGRRRARFFDSYVTDLVSRDVQQVSDIERPAELRRLLSVVAARMAPGADAVGPRDAISARPGSVIRRRCALRCA